MNVTFIVINPPDKHIGLLVNSIVDRRSAIIQNRMLTSKRIIHTIRSNFLVRSQIICLVSIQYRTLSSSWPITNTGTLGQILTAFKLFQLIASHLPHFIVCLTTNGISCSSGCIQWPWPEVRTFLTVGHRSQFQTSTIITSANPNGTRKQRMLTHCVWISYLRNFIFWVVQIPPHIATI